MTDTTDAITVHAWASPIAQTIDALQNEGRNVWIAGFDYPGTHALVIDADNDTVSLAPISTVSGLGRWECSKAHYQHHADIYHKRFPRR